MLSIFLTLPLWYQYTVVIGLGLIIGSFLNVVLYRFHTGRSLNGSSHCLSCGTGLKWYELLPLVSYVALRGRCRSCGCCIPVRYFLVESTTAALFLVMYCTFGLTALLPIGILLAIVLLMITVYDLYHMVIPDELVIATGVLAVAYVGIEYYQYRDMMSVLWHAAAGVGACSFYGLLWLVSKGRWIGFGDVKLALPLGFMLGPWGAFSFVVLSFWIGAVLSILIISIAPMRAYGRMVATAFVNLFRTCPQGSVVNYRRYFTMKSEVPFAPFIVIAFLLVFLCNVNVLTIMMSLTANL